MNWKNRLTNYNFWISIISAVLLILQALKIEFDIAYINEIATAVLGLLVVIGIISDPTRILTKNTNLAEKTEIKSNSKQEEIIKEVENKKQEIVDEVDNNEQEEIVEEENLNLQSLPSDEQVTFDNNIVQNDIENIVKHISNEKTEDSTIGLYSILINLMNDALKNNRSNEVVKENKEVEKQTEEDSENKETLETQNEFVTNNIIEVEEQEEIVKENFNNIVN